MSWLTQFGSDERGASLALVALSLVWIVGAAALVIDVGSGRLTRQALIPATDAGALAAAQDLVSTPWDVEGACATADLYVLDNAPTATMTGCQVTSFGADGGRVTITADDDFDGEFGDLGPDGSVQSVSTARWGPPQAVSLLRPLAFCYDGSAALRQVIDNPPSYTTWVRVEFVKDDPAHCGGVATVGNFATVDFESASSLSNIRSWMSDGYRTELGFDDGFVTNCDGAVTCYERPYASNDLISELTALRDSGQYVAWPIYDYADTTEVHLIGVLRARLYAFDLWGEPSSVSVELKVKPGLLAGSCCGEPAVNAGNEVIIVCGVDPGAYLGCEPSP